MSASDSTSQQLEYLREAYIYKVNAALERGREDLAAELAEDYLDEVSSLLETGSHAPG
jgi:phage shock protein A